MRWLTLALGLFLSTPALSYVRTTTKSSSPSCPGTDEKPLFWYATTIPYVIDTAGTADVTDESAFDAVRASFQTWQNVSGAYIAFRDDGKLLNAPVGYNQQGGNKFVVKWEEDTWVHSNRAIAVTLTTFDCSTGQIFDADILLNGKDFEFTTNPGVFRGRADVQNTVTHEAGHLLGFDHDPSAQSTMFADAPLGETRKRDLTAADEEGLRVVYPIGREPQLGACAQDASCIFPRGGCSAAGEGAGTGRGLLILIAILAGVLGGAWRRRRALVVRARKRW